MTEIVVTLPWPPQELKPNWRGHWAPKARKVKRYRKEACLLTREATPLQFFSYKGKAEIQCEFCAPDRRQRDEDNLVAAMKSGFDDIADRLGINDRKFHYLEHKYRFSGRQRVGYVRVHIFIGGKDES